MNMRRVLPLLAAFLLLLGTLPGCAPMRAQNPPGALSPVNAMADGDDAHLILAGADVVAYFAEGRHRQGKTQFSSTYEGVTFRFATAAHKALFDATPAKYLPQFGGYCANGIAYGIPWGGDADTWRIIDDRLYIFGGRGSLNAFELDTTRNLELAQRYWTNEIAGGNSFLQRAKRLVFRVPHYKSGEELQRLVQQSRAGTAR